MKEFDSIAAFAKHLAGLNEAFDLVEVAILDAVGKTVQAAAKDRIGRDENPAAGPFEAWQPLQQATIEEKEYLGFVDRISPNDSLYRTGALRDSIKYTVAWPFVEIGSDDEIAEYQEFGTEHIPARSFLGAAMFEQAPKMAAMAGATIEKYLAGERVKKARADGSL